MASTTITCEECGRPYETSRTNTKYCSRCRLTFDVIFIDDQTKVCWQCDEKFAPLERGQKTCGRCCYQPKKHGNAECGFCKETRPRVRTDVSCCHPCATDPKNRGALIRSLRNSQRRARAEAEAAA